MNRFLVALLALSMSVCALGCTPKVSAGGGYSVDTTPLSDLASRYGVPVPADTDANGHRLAGAVQSTALRTAIATAACSRLNGGTARLFAGASKASQNVDGTVASLTGTPITTWNLAATAFTVSNGVCTLAGTPLSATAAATATLSSANATSGYVVFISSGNAIEVIASASLAGGGAEVTFDVQPQNGGTVNLTSYTRTFPAGT